MGTFQDRTSMDRILFAVFIHENKAQGVSTPLSLMSIGFLLIRDTPHVRLYVLNMFCMRGSRLWGSRLHCSYVV